MTKTDVVKVHKEKQFLIFDLSDGKQVKYDFAKKKAIGKSGKYVQSLNHQLSGCTIYDIERLCDDEKYVRFLKFIRNHGGYSGYDIYAIGTILSRISRYSRFEQFFSAGIQQIESRFGHTIDEVPNGLIKLCRDNNIRLTNTLYKFYLENPNAYNLAFNKEYITLNSNDLEKVLTMPTSIKINDYNWESASLFNYLITQYGYTANALLDYIDYLKTFEAIEDMSDILREINDYARMMSTISNKFDKYPRHFWTTHQIATRNYKRLKKKFSEDLFKKRIDLSLEDKIGDYIFIYPKKIQDIKDEAVAQSNCVASYIDKVLDGECHIIFMRKKLEPESSLVTLEVVNNKIVQAKRRFNYPTTDKDNEAIEKWNNRHCLAKAS